MSEEVYKEWQGLVQVDVFQVENDGKEQRPKDIRVSIDCLGRQDQYPIHESIVLKVYVIHKE